MVLLMSVLGLLRLLVIATDGANLTSPVTITRNNSKLEDFMFDVKTPSRSAPVATNSSDEQVDCFGLGKTVARALEWFFLSNAEGPKALAVRFQLSSRKQPHRVEVVPGAQFGLEWTDFKIERRTVLIVHGFLSSGQESWVSEMESAFLQWDDVNVIIVDWSAGGNTWNYYKAAINTQVVGYQVAKLLEQIANTTLANEEDRNRTWGPLHLVGHSLGAHICGFVAKEFRKKHEKWKIARITGLDPAQPCFEHVDTSLKLHKTDAHFVDVIHTNAKLLSEIGFGLPEPVGHADFYPNGGRSQPGCLRLSSLQYVYPVPLPSQVLNRAICSHGRSYVYLTESLLNAVTHNCTFWARQWNLSYRDLERLEGEPCDRDSCSEMGINAEHYSQKGTFFVSTANSFPFCVNSTDLIEEVKDLLLSQYVGHLQD